MSTSDKSQRVILVVDDDADIRTAVRDVLEDEGYRVALAAHGSAALRWMAEAREPPGLILLDMMMPEMDGWQVMAEMERTPTLTDVPVLVFSAYGDVQRVESIPRAHGLLRKPLRMEELLKAVENTLQVASSDEVK
jgi:two-component system, chemotaxis family, chemotaxis protein CheY